jgi:hypothetical protein
MTQTKLPADAKVVPLVEQLRRIPKDARLTYEYSPTSHGMFPVGPLAHEAADRIAALEQSDAEQGEDAGCPPHCCCCDHYEPCCDCGEIMPSKACIGERCFCGLPAAKKVGEEILFDDPNPDRHNLTRYVCARHYAQLMGPLGAKQVGLQEDAHTPQVDKG